MFARIKRSCMEKTSRRVTVEDPDLDAQLNYCMDWEKRDKQLAKAFHNCAKCYKRDRLREQIAKNVEIIAKNSKGPMNSGAQSMHAHLIARKDEADENLTAGTQQEKVRSRYLTEKGISKNFDDRLKHFANNELRTIKDSYQALKKKRSQKESTAAAAQKDPKNQLKADIAAAEFDAHLKIVKDLMGKIPEYDKLHEDIFTLGLRYFATAF